MTTTQRYAIDLIQRERIRQNELVATMKRRGIDIVPNFYDMTDPKCNEGMKLAALTEELGEVARAMIDEPDNIAHKRYELVQLAALATGWIEALA